MVCFFSPCLVFHHFVHLYFNHKAKHKKTSKPNRSSTIITHMITTKSHPGTTATPSPPTTSPPTTTHGIISKALNGRNKNHNAKTTHPPVSSAQTPLRFPKPRPGPKNAGKHVTKDASKQVKRKGAPAVSETR